MPSTEWAAGRGPLDAVERGPARMPAGVRAGAGCGGFNAEGYAGKGSWRSGVGAARLNICGVNAQRIAAFGGAVRLLALRGSGIGNAMVGRPRGCRGGPTGIKRIFLSCFDEPRAAMQALYGGALDGWVYSIRGLPDTVYAPVHYNVDSLSEPVQRRPETGCCSVWGRGIDVSMALGFDNSR